MLKGEILSGLVFVEGPRDELRTSVSAVFVIFGLSARLIGGGGGGLVFVEVSLCTRPTVLELGFINLSLFRA